MEAVYDVRERGLTPLIEGPATLPRVKVRAPQGCCRGTWTATPAASRGRTSRTPKRPGPPSLVTGVPACSAGLARCSAGTCPASTRRGSSVWSSVGNPGADARSTRGPRPPCGGAGRRDRACRADPAGEAGSDNPRRAPFCERPARASCFVRVLAPSARSAPDPLTSQPRLCLAPSSLRPRVHGSPRCPEGGRLGKTSES